MNDKTLKPEEIEIIKQWFLPFIRLETQFPLFPGASSVNTKAALLGLSAGEVATAEAAYEETARRAALEILKDDSITDLLSQIPIKPNDSLMAIGDASTADAAGWFTILKYVLEIGLPEISITTYNYSLPSATSLDAMLFADRMLQLKKPEWVFYSIGLNDVRSLPSIPNRTLIPLADTWENLDVLAALAEKFVKNEPIWITPPPVIEEMMKEHELHQYSIQNKDLAQVRELISGKKGIVVDPRGVRLGKPNPDAWNYMADGVYHSTAGQVETVKHILRTLGRNILKN